MTDPQKKIRLEQLHRREAGALYGYLRIYLRGDDQLANAVLNQVFFEAWQKINRGEPDPSHALLKNIARKRAIDELRRKLNSRVILSATGDLENDHPGADIIAMPVPRDPLAVVLSSEFGEEFWSNLRKKGDRRDEMDRLRLTDLEYTVLVLAWLEGQSNDEIARRLHIAKGSVATHKSRAISKVRALGQIQGYIVGSGPGETSNAPVEPIENDAPIATNTTEPVEESDVVTDGFAMTFEELDEITEAFENLDEIELDEIAGAFEEEIAHHSENNQGPEASSEGEIAHER